MRKAKQDGQSWITRTAVLTLLAGFIASLGGFEAAAQDAQESPSYHGTMATSYGPNTIGPSIYDTDLKELLDKFIPTYQSTLLIFTQCYSGDFSDEFSGRENTATLTATSPGQIAYYGGYEDDAASALRPGEGRTSDDVHQAGTDGKREAETPTKSGSAVSLEDTSAEGPIKSRHVLFYAGQPDSLPDRDVDQRNEMDNNFKDKLNTSFTSVGGNPDSEGNGTDGWDYPGNFDGLKAALMEIGKQMSKDEQFILFVSDHGDRHKAFEDFDLGIDATVSITLNMDTILLEDMLIDTGNEEGVGVTFHVLPTVTFDFDQLLAGNLTVELQETNAVNNAPVHQKIDLDDPDAPTGEGKSSRLFFPFAEADLIPWEPDAFPVDENGRVPITFSITNNLGIDLSFSMATFDSGPISRLDSTTPPPPPAGPVPGTAGPGPNPPPANSSAQPGASDIPMLQFTLPNGLLFDVEVDSFTLNVSGTGNDSIEITSVKVWHDANRNGQVDDGAALGSGSFTTNDGSATISLASPHTIAASGDGVFLVTASFGTQVAALPPKAPAQGGSGAPPAWPFVLAVVIPLVLIGRGSRRLRGIAAVMLVVGLSVWFQSCGGGGGGTPPPQPQSRTYKVSLSAVGATQTSDGAVVTFDGLPVAGTNLTVTY